MSRSDHQQGIISPSSRDLRSGVAFPPEAGKRALLPRLPPGQARGVLPHTPQSSLLGAPASGISQAQLADSDALLVIRDRSKPADFSDGSRIDGFVKSRHPVEKRGPGFL
ncbi:MAG: hypothetical protein V1758_00575 [Pseudomonadota bacterium]